MIDMMGLARAALSAAVPGVEVSPDWQTGINIPAVKYLATSDGQQGNGPGLWLVMLDVSVIADPKDIAGLLQRLYSGLHACQGRSFPQAHINAVADVSVPSYGGTTRLDTRSVIQYNGTFSLLCRTIR